MATLVKCLDEIIDLSKVEKDQIRKYADDYRKEGFMAKEANLGAVDDFLKGLEKEYKDILNQIRKVSPDIADELEGKIKPKSEVQPEVQAPPEQAQGKKELSKDETTNKLENWIRNEALKKPGKDFDQKLKRVSEDIRSGKLPKGLTYDDIMRILPSTLDRETGEILDKSNPDWPRTGTLLDFLEGQEQDRIPDMSNNQTLEMSPEPDFRREPQETIDESKPIGRSDIAKFLAEKLDIPIRTGRFRDKALGIFKVKSEVVRTKMANDIEVIAHEIGHALQKFLFPNAVTKKGLSARPFSAYADELNPLATKPKAGQSPTPEGFAEFVRLYVTNAKQAQEKAPGFYSFFEDILDQKSPESKEILLEARSQYDRYMKQPALARVMSQISIGAAKARAFTWSKLYTAMFDDLYPLSAITRKMTGEDILAVARDPYKLARLLRGWGGKARAFLYDSPFKFGTYERIGESLREILRPLEENKQLNDFKAYAVAKRAIELQKRGIDSGILKSDAEAVIAQFDKDFNPIFERLKEYQDHTLQYLKDSGMLSNETYSKIKEANQEYVPFYRVFETEKGRGAGLGLEAWNPVKGIKGSWRDIQDPLESIIKNTALYINLAEKNAIGQSLINLAESHDGMGKYVEKIPSPIKGTEGILNEIFSKDELQQLEDLGIQPDQSFTIFRPSAFIPKENVVSVWKDGKRNLYEVSPAIGDTFKALDRESANMLERILSIPSKWLRAGATLTPEFIGRNPVRDFFSAMVYSKGFIFTPIDTMKGLFHAIKKDDVYWDWQRSGGAHAELVSLDRKYLQENLGDVISKYPVLNKIKNPLEALRIVSELSESATRIGEFQKVARGTKETMQAGGFAAREVSIDFARIGAKTRAINSLIAFWNANLQGSDRMVRAFKDNPVSTSMRVLAGITIPSILLAWANHDDARIKEVPQWERDLFWIVTSGHKTDKEWNMMTPEEKVQYNSEHPIWRIPKPFELGIIFGTFPERTTNWILNKDPQAFKDFMGSISRGVSPGVIPTAILPEIENWANKSMFLDRKIVPANREDMLPEYQYGPYTTEAAKGLGKLIGKLPWSPDQFKSPAKIENLIRGWSGGIGYYALQLASWGMKKTGLAEDKKSPAKTLSDIPFIKAFTVRYPTTGSESISQFYDNYIKASTQINTAKMLLKNNENVPIALQLFEQGNEGKIEVTYQSLKNMGATIDFINENPTMKEDEKREMIDIIYFQMIDAAKFGNEIYNKMKE